MNKFLETLDNYKVGVGTAIAIVGILMFGSYEAGTRGWEALNVRFVDHSEAGDFVTWYEFESREKKKNIRIMEGRIQDYKIERAGKPDPAVVVEIDKAIIILEGNIKKEKEALDCIKEQALAQQEDHNCDF